MPYIKEEVRDVTPQSNINRANANQRLRDLIQYRIGQILLLEQEIQKDNDELKTVMFRRHEKAVKAVQSRIAWKEGEMKRLKTKLTASREEKENRAKKSMFR